MNVDVCRFIIISNNEEKNTILSLLNVIKTKYNQLERTDCLESNEFITYTLNSNEFIPQKVGRELNNTLTLVGNFNQ